MIFIAGGLPTSCAAMCWGSVGGNRSAMTANFAPALPMLQARCVAISRKGSRASESGQIVQFFRYALASLAEVKDYLTECEERGVIDSVELARLADRCEHTKATATKFMKPHLTKMQRSKRPRPPD